MLENSAEAITILDRKGRFIRWNKRAVEIFGYSPDEMQERHFSEFCARQEDMERLLASLRRNDSVREQEAAFLDKNGVAIP